ncbi:MAG: hypothetical protein M8841_00365 [marine benthic group bacterium]|jgi:hypothetical protein|nr:hypothetical protein [Gemmatimonadota bacterium]MCL7957655.1 hypothetical protein [Gemmatimonadota bacterium]MCL7967210.1 hypothetical protein [Gemmatimonadota bacterium]MCL7974906.1 hypothetical protein [Gemmatimonadota bacterium]MCL7984474.1 hypothetical protein [Gemmatimonadota bacterium]
MNTVEFYAQGVARMGICVDRCVNGAMSPADLVGFVTKIYGDMYTELARKVGQERADKLVEREVSKVRALLIPTEPEPEDDVAPGRSDWH